MSDDDRPYISVYVGNISMYDADGEMRGGWLDPPVSDAGLQSFLRDVVGLNDQYREYSIHDSENNLGIRIGENASLDDLNLLAGVLGKAYESDPLVAEKIRLALDANADPGPLGVANWARQADEIPYHAYDVPAGMECGSPEERYGYSLIEEGAVDPDLKAVLDGPYGGYFDVEAWGRDCANDVYLGENGYYDPQESMPDADLYDRRELAEYAGLDTDEARPFSLESLVGENESIAEYTLADTGTNWGSPRYRCVIADGSTDIAAALEDTLGRIIADRADAGADDADEVIRETMGAERFDDASDIGSGSIIDRGYALPGAITSFNRVASSPSGVDPADPMSIAMTGSPASGLAL